MKEIVPENLEPVTYFLQGINNESSLWFIRIAFGIAVLASIIVFCCFIKRLPGDDGQSRGKKKG
ncbi:MAG: hypothetical protein LBD48_02265 [Treponema sp.]|nr:hypothetical protein [Treponema sp.]